MNAPIANQGRNPFDDPIDRILAEIALSAQLPPSLHRKAVDRYGAVRKYLEADDAFNGEIEHFYPQGSMAIDGTISTRGTDDEYDIDIVAQLGGRFRSMDPLSILKELERALKDYPVRKVVRQTRCVTLFYSDNMHLDVTPSLRAYGTADRESYITHAKGPFAGPDDQFVDMNAYGFAEWYRANTPLEQRLARAFRDRWFAMDAALAKAAEIDEVPEQCDFVVKNTATLALQLLKRYRNICYAHYDGRIPPSVMLSYYAGVSARPNMSLSDMLVRVANWIKGDIDEANRRGRLLHVANPVTPDDVFTDRWPASFVQQEEFARHLERLVVGVEAAKRGEVTPDKLTNWLRAQFGDKVVTMAVDRMADMIGQSVQDAAHSYSRKGGLILPAAAASGLAVAPSVVRASPHTFFGERI